MKLYIGLIWILTTATALVAFPAPLHRRITEDVLRRLLPPHLDIAYSQFAIAEIVNANECTDVGPEMFQQDPDTPCIPNRSSLVEFRGAQSRAQDHFDDERISDGVLRLQALRAWIAADIADGRYVMVRKRIGAAAHAIQDFYAHTNWIELGIATFFEDKHGNFAFRQPNRLLRVASKYEDVCIAIHRDRYNQEVTVQPNLLPEATGGDGTVLTSGYFFSSVRGVAKCLHGLVSPGIAKDLPIGEGKYNRAAEDLATRHTEQFVQSIIEQLLGDTKALRGVFGSFTVLGNDMNLVPSHVFKGERYEFKTNPEGRVTWGFNSPLGLNNPISSGPGGTPNISAGNYYWYKPPPLPLEPVGALIGSIYSKDCDFGQPAALAPPDLPSTLCSPKHIFMIGEARKVTIEVSGRLYLHVNDSNLANNGGYFETIFTLIPRAGR